MKVCIEAIVLDRTTFPPLYRIHFTVDGVRDSVAVQLTYLSDDPQDRVWSAIRGYLARKMDVATSIPGLIGQERVL